MIICRIILDCQISLQKGYIDFFIFHSLWKCPFPTLAHTLNMIYLLHFFAFLSLWCMFQMKMTFFGWIKIEHVCALGKCFFAKNLLFNKLCINHFIWASQLVCVCVHHVCGTLSDSRALFTQHLLCS